MSPDAFLTIYAAAGNASQGNLAMHDKVMLGFFITLAAAVVGILIMWAIWRYFRRKNTPSRVQEDV